MTDNQIMATVHLKVHLEVMRRLEQAVGNLATKEVVK